MSDDSDDPEVLLNQAVEYHQEKRLHEAESLYLLLLEHLPHVPEINNLYALLLTQTDRSEAAIPYLKVVSDADPSDQNLLRLAVICLKHDKFEEALSAIDGVLENNPTHMEARILQARGLQSNGQQRDALLKFDALLQEKPDSAMILHHLGQCLHQYEAGKFDAEVAGIFAALLKHPDIQPQKLFHKAIALLLLHDDLENGFEDLKAFLSSPLFTVILDECLIVNAELEQLLIKLRRYFLESLMTAGGQKIISQNADFLCHLANQCFFNEYVYPITEEEGKALVNITSLFGDTAEAMQDFNKGLLGLCGSYSPLNQSSLKGQAVSMAAQINDNQLNTLIRLQITEPTLEQKLARDLPALGDIADAVSQKVQSLYEQSPYPRWKHYNEITPRSFLEDLTRQIPKFDSDGLSFTDTPDILIAGGGTGQHPLTTARAIEGAQVTAIDLSRRSLSYAMRKAEEMNVKNISFQQADILDLQKLGKQFDVIESVGVIHHMEDPVQGLRNLNDQLKPGGYMKIGIYSKSARQPFNLAREKIREMGIADDDNSIRNFRKLAFDLPQSDPLSTITKAHDFYALSSCRDLLFHVQEHQFTIPEIEQVINDLGLEFLGFNFTTLDQFKAFKTLRPAKGSETRLAYWTEFEEKAPNCFGAMYVFWLRKPV